jgi:transcriptional regulator with XRE-family HTH domain
MPISTASSRGWDFLTEFQMNSDDLQARPDWDSLRVRLGDLLKRRAFARGLDATETGIKVGLKGYKVERVFDGSARQAERYARIVGALDWSLDEALEHLERHQTPTLPAPRVRRGSEHATLTLAGPTPEPEPEPEIEARPRATDEPDAEEALANEDLFVAPEGSPNAPVTFEDHRERLAGELKERLTATGKSQSAFARALGVSQSTISSVLAAHPKRRQHYDALARELGLYISADYELVEVLGTPEPAAPEPEPAAVSEDAIEEVEQKLTTAPVHTTPEPTPTEQAPAEPTPAPVEAVEATLAAAGSASDGGMVLDDGLTELIEWSAAQRGIEPRIWLALAVAAYHESYRGS